MDITKIDRNFLSTFSFEGMKTYDVNEDLFSLYGLCREGEERDFKRLPHSLPLTFENPPVRSLYKNTSGIRVRFQTDSQRIVLKCVLPGVNKLPSMPMVGVAGFDLYADGEYCNSFRPGVNLDGDFDEIQLSDTGYASGYTFRTKKMRQILIHFPLYNDVDQVFIALEEDARILPPKPYRHEKPVVFYGNSVTQGGSASHPGNSYVNMLSRWLDADVLNLGFSAGGWGEIEMADYIGHLEMSAFVMDYDHNAPTIEHLRKTHQPFFERIRSLQPELPIIMVSASDLYAEDTDERRQVILQTYQQARDQGDKNVYFVNGGETYKDFGRSHCLVDNCHPNDLGFWCMAQAIGKPLKLALE